ncbi:MAG: hypothetical protein OXI30_20265 [Chloroflexota bacterium]|nr:hypothetical protein [Chloroflexota bacterium]
MNILPHIDIIEPERIAALFADERNFSWRAVDSERLDSWSPDLGLTGYQNPSIYRAGEVAASGISSSLRHRFWQTVQGQADHTGERYIGILIYCQAGETCPMDLQLASNIIGRVEPQRHDNRLHLIVVDQPVEFMGEMEIFRLTAPGKGAYRIEAFALLHERPAPSRFAPEIQDVTIRQSHWKDKCCSHVHVLTSRVCSLTVNFQVKFDDPKADYDFDQKSGPTRLHNISAEFGAARRIIATITAHEASGAIASRTIAFSTTKPEPPETDELIVPAELINLGAAELAGLPLQFGLPLAQGALYEPEHGFIQAGGERIPALPQVLARWPDDSARWLLIRSQAPAGLAGSGSLAATVHINGEDSAPEIREGFDGDLAEAAGFTLRPRKDEGDHRPAFMSLSDWRFDAMLSNGMALASAFNTEPDSIRGGAATVTVDHMDDDGIAHLRSHLRLQFYPDQTFVKLYHRLEVISPALAPAQGGHIPADCSADMRENIVGESGEESALLKLRSFSLHIPFAGIKSVRHGGEEWRLGGKNWGLRHDHDLAHTINGEEREGRAKGHIRVEGEAGSLGIGLRNFWQTYPKALTAGGGGIDIALFPERRGLELPGDEDAPHRLYFWLDEGGYKLKAGMALSSEILLDFGAGDPAVFDWLEHPLMVRPDIDYVNSTGALNPIGARRDSALPNYEELADLAIRSFYDDQEHYRAFGQVNFGDWYGESGWSWGNNEYDPAYVGYTEFLRGGDPSWARWAADSARHLADVDTINYSSDPSQIGGQAMHIAGHLGGYLPPFFRSKMRGTSAGPAHMWVEGPLLHYLMTGDEFVYDSLCKTKQWLIQNQRLDHYEYKSARDSGWHLIHLTMLAAALDDPDCLNAARIIVERVLERQAPGGGWERVLGEPHCGCGFPRCQGEAGFMVCILVSGLMRYHRLTSDAAVADSIIGGARWLIRETFDDASGYFRYTSCPNRSLGGNYQCTQWVMEGLAAAWELSGDREIGRQLKRGLATIGMYPARLSHMGVGKAMSQQMRYVPTILAALNQRPLEGIDD